MQPAPVSLSSYGGPVGSGRLLDSGLFFERCSHCPKFSQLPHPSPAASTLGAQRSAVASPPPPIGGHLRRLDSAPLVSLFGATSVAWQLPRVWRSGRMSAWLRPSAPGVHCKPAPCAPRAGYFAAGCSCSLPRARQGAMTHGGCGHAIAGATCTAWRGPAPSGCPSLDRKGGGCGYARTVRYNELAAAHVIRKIRR